MFCADTNAWFGWHGIQERRYSRQARLRGLGDMQLIAGDRIFYVLALLYELLAVAGQASFVLCRIVEAMHCMVGFVEVKGHVCSSSAD